MNRTLLVALAIVGAAALIGAEYMREVMPGELVTFCEGGMQSRMVVEGARRSGVPLVVAAIREETDPSMDQRAERVKEMLELVQLQRGFRRGVLAANHDDRICANHQSRGVSFANLASLGLRGPDSVSLRRLVMVAIRFRNATGIYPKFQTQVPQNLLPARRG